MNSIIFYIFVFYSLIQINSSEREQLRRKSRQVVVPSFDNGNTGKKIILYPSYPYYPAQYQPLQYQPSGFAYPAYPFPGNIYGNYPYYGNVYQGNAYPYQTGNYYDRFAHIPTHIVDIPQNGDPITQNGSPGFKIQQGNVQSTGNYKQFPIKYVKTSYATTKPITITIQRNGNQKDSVISYNFKNGELVDERSLVTTTIRNLENKKPTAIRKYSDISSFSTKNKNEDKKDNYNSDNSTRRKNNSSFKNNKTDRIEGKTRYNNK